MATRKPKAEAKSAMAGKDAGNPLFDETIAAFAADPTVTTGRMFTATGLKTGNKVFAMGWRGAMVVKLPRARAEAMAAAGAGVPFEPGPGRIMKEWVVVQPAPLADWVALAKEARAYVDSLREA